MRPLEARGGALPPPQHQQVEEKKLIPDWLKRQLEGEYHWREIQEGIWEVEKR